MVFEINRTGLDAGQKYLDVTSNNIANASSFGFKKSRTQFADVYKGDDPNSMPAAQTGSGVYTADVQQLFGQGFLKMTDNLFDISIDGDGFFATSTKDDLKDTLYTRAGAFHVNKDNDIVNAFDNYLLGYPVDKDGDSTNVSQQALNKIRIPSVMGDPEQTKKIEFKMNFPALKSEEAKELSKFNPKDSETYHYSTGVGFYDSTGAEHILNIYYIKPTVNRPTQFFENTAGNIIPTDSDDLDASFDVFSNKGIPRPDDPSLAVTAPDAYQNHQLYVAFYEVDGKPIQPVNGGDGVEAAHWNFSYDAQKEVENDPVFKDLVINDKVRDDDYPLIEDTTDPWFGSAVLMDHGMLVTAAPSFPVKLQSLGSMAEPTLSAGADGNQVLEITYTDSTMYSSTFQIYDQSVDGYKVGNINGVDIREDGLVFVSYDNEQSSAVARIAIAQFNNVNGLNQIGDTSWQETSRSGRPRFGEADHLSFGRIGSGSIELSNVELSTQLIELIIAQRNYQASAKALDTENTLQQTIIQMS